MKFGISPFVTDEGIESGALARVIEERGFDSLFVAEHSGLASGVNNAVARVAGLLAVAVLGVVVYGGFSANLDARLESMDLSGTVRNELEAEKVDLGAAEAPKGVDARTAAQIERAVDESFVPAFRAVTLVSSGLALASALVAALLVGDRVVRSMSRVPSPSDWR